MSVERLALFCINRYKRWHCYTSDFGRREMINGAFNLIEFFIQKRCVSKLRAIDLKLTNVTEDLSRK